jgi:hypothetical protein
MREQEDAQILALFERHGTLTLWGVAAMLHGSTNYRATRAELAATRKALDRLVADGSLVTIGLPRRRTFHAALGASSSDGSDGPARRSADRP